MKVYSPAALQALEDVLATMHYYKDSLKSFLVRAGVPRHQVDSLDWTYKRIAAKQLVNDLSAIRPVGTEILGKLIGSAVEQEEAFPHLARLTDGKRLVADAQQALRALKDIVGRETVVEQAERARQEKRTEADRARAVYVDRVESLRGLYGRFADLTTMKDHQKRGIAFQDLLRDLFSLYDLQPRGSFAVPGEQIDGSITVDGRVLLIEARWTDPRTEPKEVRDFMTKVRGRLETTLGLFVSMAGFSDDATNAVVKEGRMLVVLMDGIDLAPILEGRYDLAEVLKSKLRRASDEGRPMTRFGE